MPEQTAKPDDRLSQSNLRSPRAAAFAGIGFALMSGASLILVRLSFPENVADPATWLADQAKTLSLAMSLIPFAGIAFLWFMGVVREQIGRLEDQFFSTLFFGTGYLFLGMTFIAAALAGGALVLYASDPDLSTSSGILALSLTVSNRINSVYAMRMAGTFMSVLGTIWLRTGVMPRWMALITYLLAMVLLVSIGFTLWVFLIFPAWVFVISIATLISNDRLTPGQKDEDA
jgi:hypothetical protein